MKAKLQAILAAIGADIADTYKRSKMLILAIGAAIVYLEFNKIKEALLLYGSKKELASDKKEDQTLATQEKSDSDQADALVKAAQDLPNQEPTVKPDWYKKDQK